jgi:acetoin utilization deacetylase AcuC-like enzyme
MGVRHAVRQPPRGEVSGPAVVTASGHEAHDPAIEVAGGQALAAFERASRVAAILAALEAEPIDAQPHRTEALLALHAPDLLTFLEQASAEAGHRDDLPGGLLFAGTFQHAGLVPGGPAPSDVGALTGRYCFDTITGIGPATWPAARRAADAALTASALVSRGGHDAALALSRPPGHHASRDLFGGGCFLNNAAITAQALRGSGAAKVAVVDLDVHHGNGTQALFYDRPDVYYLSLHCDPAVTYPYFTGYADERGSGEGEGANRNLPLAVDVDGEGYLEALVGALESVRDFGPAALVVSLSVDALEGDTTGGGRLAPADYGPIGARLAELNLSAVVVLEGGYLLERIGPAVAAFWEGLTVHSVAASGGGR